MTQVKQPSTPKRRTTELISDICDPQKILSKKTYVGGKLIKQEDFRDQERYVRYFKNGILSKAILFAPHETRFTFITNKKGILSKAKIVTDNRQGQHSIKHHHHVMLVNNFPFAVDCCKKTNTIKVATMTLL